MIEFDIPNYRRIDSKLYEKEKRKLLIELVKLQDWVIQEKKKIAVVFAWNLAWNPIIQNDLTID